MGWAPAEGRARQPGCAALELRGREPKGAPAPRERGAEPPARPRRLRESGTPEGPEAGRCGP